VSDIGIYRQLTLTEPHSEYNSPGNAMLLKAILFCCIFLLGVGSGQSPKDESVPHDSTFRASVHMERPNPDDPVRVYGLFEGSSDIAPFTHDPQITRNLLHPYSLWNNVSFQAGEDWLENLVIVVKNLSNKEVVAGTVNIRFPETGSGAPGDAFIGQSITMGQRPEYALYATRDGQRSNIIGTEPISIKPGQDMKFVLAPYVSEMRQEIETKRSFSTITRVALMLGPFYFSDGTRWASYSGFQKPDPNAPGKYARITAEEFKKTNGSY
jgi:hypothetical protein